MMKRMHYRLSKLFTLIILTTACAVPVLAAEEGDVKKLRSALEEDELYVQSGEFREFDTVKLASEGKLLSCFGNNAGSAYLVFNLPAAPDQDTSLGSKERGWPDEIASEYDDPDIDNAPANPYFAPGGWEYKLRQDEAIVLITPLPEECKYYSFINYIMFTENKPGKNYEGLPGMFTVGNEDTGLYHPIFGSIGNSLNMTNIKHSGDSIYGTEAVIVISANRKVTDRVIKALETAGYDEDMINVMPIPAETYRMGLEKGADTFSFLQRVSQPEDKDAYQDYLEHISERSTLYRITPVEEVSGNPYKNETVIPRGTGVHESAGLKNAEETLDTIRRELIDKYSDEYDFEELSCEIAVPEGLTAYYTDFNAKGDNRDAMYLMTPEFTLDSDEDFVVAYGVNHTAAGKGIYSNAVLYAKPMLNGVTSIYDSLYKGSAAEWLDDGNADADKYYVYKMARTKMDKNTAIIPYSTGNEQGKFFGVDNGNPVLVAFRSYLEDTGAGASYYEVVYDRVIVFHKKAADEAEDKSTDEKISDEKDSGTQGSKDSSLNALTGKLTSLAKNLIGSVDTDTVSSLIMSVAQDTMGSDRTPIPEGKPTEGSVKGEVDDLKYNILGAKHIEDEEEGDIIVFYYDITNNSDTIRDTWEGNYEASQNGSFLDTVWMEDNMPEAPLADLSFAPGKTNRGCTAFAYDPKGGVVSFRISSYTGDSTVIYYADPEDLSGAPGPFVLELDPSTPEFLKGLPEKSGDVSIEEAEFFKDEEGDPCVRFYFNFQNKSKDESLSFGYDHGCYAMQDGFAIDWNWATVDEENNPWKDVEPGGKILCAKSFKLRTDSPVTFVIQSNGDEGAYAIAKTVKVKEGTGK